MSIPIAPNQAQRPFLQVRLRFSIISCKACTGPIETLNESIPKYIATPDGFFGFRRKCVNIGRYTISKCINLEVDKVWYNDVQRSFLEAVRDRYLTSRQFSEVEMKWLADTRRAKDPDNYLRESSAVMDLRQGF